MPSKFSDQQVPRIRHQETSVALPDCIPIHDEPNMKGISALFQPIAASSEGTGRRRHNECQAYILFSEREFLQTSENKHVTWKIRGRRSSVTTATTLGLDRPGYGSRSENISFPTTPTRVLGSNQPQVQWVSMFFPGGKRPERYVDRSPPSSAKVETQWSYVSTPPPCLHGAYGTNLP
jgi:hypothetical protein